MTRIRVLLADDHAVVRQGIRDFLAESPDIEVVAEASDGETAKALIEEQQPDVAVLDIRMPGATGIDIARWAQERGLRVRILLLSAFSDDPFVIAAVQAGASGYVLKNAEADEIIAAVLSVAQGRAAFSKDMTDRVLVHASEMVGPVTVSDRLTERESEVLRLAAAGLTNRGIGHKLGISDRTVQGHLASIYEKLGVGSRTEAVTRALHMGLIELHDPRP